MSKNFPRKLPEKLSLIREQLGLTVDELASRLNATNGTVIQAYESGGEDLPSSVLVAYAKLAGIHVENLLDDDDDLPQQISVAAQIETISANQSVTALKTPGSKRDNDLQRANWRDIEPILKWAAVAYAFGFLTVMLHTYKLGIPVLQLIEPVNIWIGAPLAVVVFFLDKLFGLAKKATADFVQNVAEARQIRDEVRASRGDPLELFQKIILVLSSIWVPSFPLSFVQSVPKFFVSKYLGRKTTSIEQLNSSDDRVSEPAREWLLTWTGRILSGAYLVAAVSRLVNFAGMVLLIPLACFIYVYVIFPLVPQSLGGGAPMTVELLVSDEALPKTDMFREWQPADAKGPDPVAAPNNEMKVSIVVPVTLYYRTEGQLYVRKGSGPIVCLSDHAIQGIVFH